MTKLMIEEGFDDPAQSSCDGRSKSNFHLRPSQQENVTIFAKLFLRLLYKNWVDRLFDLNKAIVESNISNSGRKIKEFTSGEFLMAHALMIGATSYSANGSKLWDQSDSKSMGDEDWDTIVSSPNFDQYMKLYRFKEFRKFLPKMFENKDKKESDPWWQFVDAIDDFNDIRKVSNISFFDCYLLIPFQLLSLFILFLQTRVITSWTKIMDEAMSAFKPRTTKTGGLPNISFIQRKPEPLGTEFKNVCCPVTGVCSVLEIQRGKVANPYMKHNKELGATAGCTMRLAEMAQQAEHSNSDLIMGDAWFGSVTAALELAKKGKEAFLQVKTNSGMFPKQFINDALEDAPGGVHLVLKGKFCIKYFF